MGSEYEAVIFHDNNCLNRDVETFKDVERFIEARFDDDLSRYHIYVNQDGTISMGHSFKSPSVFAGKFDGKVISVYLVGNFVQDQMSSSQEETLIALCASLYHRFEISEDKWIPHREILDVGTARFGSTNCPGQNFPMEKIRDIVRRDRESNERIEENGKKNGRPSEMLERLIESESLDDTCDAIRSINNRIRDHCQSFSRVQEFVDNIAV